MSTGQFLKGNSNVDILEVLELISGTQVDLENDILVDYNREWFIVTTLHVTHVYMPVFQGEYEFHSNRSADDHFEGPGALRQQHTHQLRPGIAYILKTYM